MPIRVLFTSLKHKLSVVQSSSKNLDLSRLLLRVISCESVIEMCHAALANQRTENRWATNEKRDKAGCFSLWLYKILWEVAILILHCTSSRARAYRFSLLLSSLTERNENIPVCSPALASGVTWLCQSASQSGHELTLALTRPGLSVFTFWHPGCQLCHILMNLAIISGEHRAAGITALTSRHASRASHLRICVRIFINTGHLTNNNHYWISEFSDRKKSHDLKFIRHSACSRLGAGR